MRDAVRELHREWGDEGRSDAARLVRKPRVRATRVLGAWIEDARSRAIGELDVFGMLCDESYGVNDE